jgi:hypothetical protein
MKASDNLMRKNRSRTVLIAADHGLAVVYFLQSDVVSQLIDAGYEVVFLTADSLQEKIQKRFGREGMKVAGLHLDAAARLETRWRDLQWWLVFMRRVSGAVKINTGAMDSYIEQVAVEEPNRRRMFMPLARMLIWLLRRSAWLRTKLVLLQSLFTFDLYSDLFEEYRPDLLVTSTPGWRLDRYLLREAHRSGIPTASVIVGWDNPSSYSVPGAVVDQILCWSEIQKKELVDGSDWAPSQVHVVGIPSYDGYFTKRWLTSREEYFRLHGLDPSKKLLSYACSFVSFSPNLQNIEALVKLVESGELKDPSQLLIRLHPNHFMDNHLFMDERQKIQALADAHPNIHLVQPVALGGELGYYSGEDMPEKASMMAHSDVFLTVYSTMVVEAAIHDRPIISVCIDAPNGWNTPRKYSLRLSEIGNWPTHRRFIEAGAGKVAANTDQLRSAINDYLQDPDCDHEARAAFVQREITYTDGTAGRRAGQTLVSFVEGRRR